MRSSSPTQADLVTRCQPLLGTLVEVTVPTSAGDAIDPAFAAVRHVHRRMSFHEANSDLALLRAAPPGSAVELDPQTVAVLRLALALHEQSGGLFDVTIGRELVRSGFLPRPDIASLRQFPGRSRDIEIVDDRHVCCRRPALIDLGGIAKGYAVDRAVEALIACGAREGLVNAGGDLRAFGPRPWPVALRDADGTITRSYELTESALASSSNLLDRRRRGGRTWSPHLGRGRKPMLCDRTVSVRAESCAVDDVMTKVAMADPALAAAMLAAVGGCVLSGSASRSAA